MFIKPIHRLFCACLAALLLSACASTRVPTTGNRSSSEDSPSPSGVVAASPSYHHILAWVPVELAKLAAVAKAKVHVALSRAKQSAQEDLCDGEWVVSGEIAETVEPVATTAPAAMGEFPAWYYRVSWLPAESHCPNADAQQFHAAINAQLPPWMRMQSAALDLPTTAPSTTTGNLTSANDRIQ